MKNLQFLFWAYTIIWLILAAYLVTITLRLRSISSQIRRLRARLSTPDEEGA